MFNGTFLVCFESVSFVSPTAASLTVSKCCCHGDVRTDINPVSTRFTGTMFQVKLHSYPQGTRCGTNYIYLSFFWIIPFISNCFMNTNHNMTSHEHVSGLALLTINCAQLSPFLSLWRPSSPPPPPSSSSCLSVLIRAEAEQPQRQPSRNQTITRLIKSHVTPPSLWWTICVFFMFPLPSLSPLHALHCSLAGHKCLIRCLAVHVNEERTAGCF